MAIDGITPALTNPYAVALEARPQGVVDRAALQTALTSTVVPTSKTAPEPTLAQALDRNGNGTVTTEELTAQTQTLADRLFGNLRQTVEAGPVPIEPDRKASLSELKPAASQEAARDSSAVQLGNPGRVMALMNLVDLVSAYGPTGQPNTPTLPSGKTVDVSA